MVFITSTNGTPTSAAWNRSGRILRTAPITKPPALRPSMTRRSFEPYPWVTRYSAEAMKNTFTDFIASAEYLVTHGYGSKDRLVIEGRSAGGLLMGAVLNMRPDLFHAALRSEERRVGKE